jgi:hypothetical protein
MLSWAIRRSAIITRSAGLWADAVARIAAEEPSTEIPNGSGTGRSPDTQA